MDGPAARPLKDLHGTGTAARYDFIDVGNADLLEQCLANRHRKVKIFSFQPKRASLAATDVGKRLNPKTGYLPQELDDLSAAVQGAEMAGVMIADRQVLFPESESELPPVAEQDEIFEYVIAMPGDPPGCLVAEDPRVFHLDGQRTAGLAEDDIKTLGHKVGQHVRVEANVRQHLINGSRVDPRHPTTVEVRQKDLEPVGPKDLKSSPPFAFVPVQVAVAVHEKDDSLPPLRLVRSGQVFSKRLPLKGGKFATMVQAKGFFHELSGWPEPVCQIRQAGQRSPCFA